MTDQKHDVGPQQIFFSVTDDKGVITDANSVFVNISRYPREDLNGSPHNIIRNPEMPGGAFRLMWDNLEAGKPFIAYVRNQAKDGLPYEVLSTVTPLVEGGYLSVRTRVSDPDFASKIWWLYGETRAKEDELLGDGKNRREAAEMGAHFIDKKVGDYNFASYEEAQRFILPHEIAAWEKNFGDTAVTDVTEGDLVPLSRAVSQLRTEEEAWSSRQDAMAELANRLTDVAGKTKESLDHTAELKSQADAWSDKLTPMESIPLNVAVSMGSIVSEYVDDLATKLADLKTCIETARFTIALARVQTHSLASFVRETADGYPGIPSMKTLTSALTTEVEAMGKDVEAYTQNLARCERRLRAVLSLVEIPQQMIMDWWKNVQEFGPSIEMPELISAVAAEIESTGTMVTELNELLGQLSTIEQKSPQQMLHVLDTVDAEVRKLQV
ncbi:MAG: PAS domain-containing protein [Corynebacterium glucuronolyticum]|nr:PAS domain-containing protein [Corynebacterium glucuronolyticum]MDD7585601.1 PAS domain-containing protein [Mycobacteriaceae bacterium]MDY5835349.1 PAS domain-containing protein [Corynebacterium glucuronolyticum]